MPTELTEREKVIEVMARAIAGADENPEVNRVNLYAQGSYREMVTGFSQAAVQALHEAGYAIVPVKPTDAMVNASWALAGGQSPVAKANDHARQCTAYKAMIQASQPFGEHHAKDT